MCSLKINKHFLDMTICLNTLFIIIMKTQSFPNTQSVDSLAYVMAVTEPSLYGFIWSLNIIPLHFHVCRLIKRIILHFIFLFLLLFITFALTFYSLLCAFFLVEGKKIYVILFLCVFRHRVCLSYCLLLLFLNGY